LVAAGALSSMAQSNVYSLNVVGYVNISLTNGYQMVANQMDLDGTGTNNTLASVFGTALPNLTQVLAWNPAGQTFVLSTYRASTGVFGGDPADVTTFGLQPGQGVFVNLNNSAAPTTITTVGTVMQAGSGVPAKLPQGYSIVSSQAPLSGGLTTVLGYPAGNLDQALTWDVVNQTYVLSTYRAATSTWGGAGEPNVAVGQSLFVNVHSAAGATWTNTFVVQ
jgi:hypothetical protein